LNEIDCVDGFHNLQCSYDQTSGIETIGFSSNPTFASVNSTALYSQVCTCGNLQVGSNGTVLIRVIDPNNNVVSAPNPILTQGNITFSTTPTYATVTTTGNANVGGNLAVTGTITAGTQNPGTSNAAGDIRGFRLSVNGNAQFLPTNGEFFQIGANVADTASGLVYGGVMTTNLIAPSASNSTISGYLIIGQTASFGGADPAASYNSVSAAQTVFQHNTRSSFTLAAAHTFGVTFSTNTFNGTIGNAVSVNVSPLSIVGTSAGTITNLIGVRVLPPQSGGLAVTNIYGSYITAQTAANGSVVVVGQRIDAPSPCGSGVCAAQYLADTTGSAAGGINFGADTTLYRSAAGILRTDGAFWAGSSSLNNIRLAPGASNAISYINAGSNSLAVNPPSGSSFYVMNGGIVNMQFQSVSGSTTYLRSTPSVSAGHTLQAWSDTDTNENFNLYSKGAGVMNLGTGGVRTIQLLQSTPSDVNYLTFTSASGGNSPVISAAGTDTNSDVKVAPKGTGVLNVAGGVTASGNANVGGNLAVTGLISAGASVNVTGVVDFSNSNVNVGRSAGGSVTTSYNVNIGWQAGQFRTAAGNANNIGYQAGQYDLGVDTINHGYQAGQYNNATSVINMGSFAGQFQRAGCCGGENINMGTYAGQYNSGDNVNSLGQQASQYNTAGNINDFGFLAGQNNTCANVNNLGGQAGQYCGGSGGNNNNFGLTAGQFATGNGLNNFGLSAGQNCTTSAGGNNFGSYAGQYASGTDHNLLGTRAGQYNSGSRVNAAGNNACQYNTGSDVTASGLNAAANNTGSNCFFSGNSAGQQCVANHVIGIGLQAAQTTSGGDIVCLGNTACQANTGTGGLFVGREAGKSNTGSFVGLFGYQSGTTNAFAHCWAFGRSGGCTTANQFAIGSSLYPLMFAITSVSPASQAFGDVTASGMSGILTFTVSTAAATCQTATITNSNVVSSTSVILAIQSYSGTPFTNGNPQVYRSNAGGSSTGSFTLYLCNLHATNALSGTLVIHYELRARI
jgi:hypothetical protein